MQDNPNKPGAMTRRAFIKAAAGAAIAAPYISRAASNSGVVVVRSAGGSTEENNRKNIWTPFERETGIRVVPVAATAGKLLAMQKAGNAELDVIDIGADQLLSLSRRGALASIDYASWKKAVPSDIPNEYKSEQWVGYSLYGALLGYSTQDFPTSHPTSWQDFWDVKKFAGPRALRGLASGNPDLEFALLADGVPRDKLYPLDLPRAFASLNRIRSSIPKFWETGALSVQMLTDREVLMSSMWTTRIIPAIRSGVRLGYEWKDHLIMVQSYGIFKKAPNFDNAQRFIEFALRPENNSVNAMTQGAGPTNSKSAPLLPREYVDNNVGGANTRSQGILMDINWWEDHREEIGREWAKWIQS